MTCEAKEECGIAAAYVQKRDNSALFYLYRMLINLQNRGQLSAGFTTYDKYRPELLKTLKNLGTVNEVFRTNNLAKSMDIFKRYSGDRGIGHIRYATSGADDVNYAMPFERKHGRMWKWFSFCFNGNLANHRVLKKKLIERTNYHFILKADTEMVMHYISRELKGDKKVPIFNVFHNLSKIFDGAYNITFINSYGEMAIIRDPFGFRPLCYGSRDSIFLAASESNALINSGVGRYKSLEPGKMITIINDSIEIRRYCSSKRKAYCMFEWVYFSNVGSVIDNKSVYLARRNLGKELAKIETENISKDHIVVSVPDSAKPAGDGYAYSLGIPIEEGLIRNRYVGRTFIESSKRGDKVKNKFTAIKEVLNGKKVLLVDDSIVRGTTSKQIVNFVKRIGGAKEVHLRVSCPPIKGPCFYGIDMSTFSELLVPQFEKDMHSEFISEKTCEKIAKSLGADSLIYQTIPGLIRSIGLPKKDLCLACLNCHYQTNYGRILAKEAYDRFRKGIKEKERTYDID